MKTLWTLFVLFLIVAPSFAQTGFRNRDDEQRRMPQKTSPYCTDPITVRPCQYTDAQLKQMDERNRQSRAGRDVQASSSPRDTATGIDWGGILQPAWNDPVIRVLLIILAIAIPYGVYNLIMWQKTEAQCGRLRKERDRLQEEFNEEAMRIAEEYDNLRERIPQGNRKR